MHTFCDASEQAYVAAVYLKIQDGNSSDVVLVASKARVAPLRNQTIPKLELMAAVLGVRLAKTTQETLDFTINNKYFWTDSTTVIHWIHSEKKLPCFVSSRIGEILESSDPKEWRWVPTDQNVADDCTRDVPMISLNPHHRWFVGPDFLLLSEKEWPKIFTPAESVYTQEIVNVVSTSEITETLPSIKSYYTLIRILRTTAWIKRFIENVRRKKEDRNFEPPDVHKMQWSKIQWYKAVQANFFSKDMENIQAGKPNRNGRLFKLNLIFDDEFGLLRISGRLQHASCVELNTKNPICLSGDHPYTKALIRHVHKQNGHQGTENVINELRKEYWIPKIISYVKKVISQCMKCKKKNSTPCQPIMGLLPKERFKIYEKPFSATGVDYFGPYLIKVHRKLEKRYGVLFTCLTTRAIHVEIADSLTADSCVMAIRQILARRGTIKTMWSDNGTNLRAANRELIEALDELDQVQMKNELSRIGIDWHFIPPAAPHMGGSWERLIGTFKRTVNATLQEIHPTDEVLRTFFAEAEYIVNSRPLTYPSSDSSDLTSISPNDILIGKSVEIGTPGLFTKDDKIHRKQWRISQYLAEVFWKRWLQEYVPTLLNRKKWTEDHQNLKEGEIVLIGDKNKPRATWPLGRVVKVFPGSDRVTRVADVQTKFGLSRRPVVNLHCLTVCDDEESSRGEKMCPPN